MFTGLIETIGKIKRISAVGDRFVMEIASDLPQSEIKVGESISVDGACLTVFEKSNDFISFEASPESITRTTLAQKRVGEPVHLERALRLSDRLGGHIVQGHVDGIGRIKEVEKEKNSWWLTVSLAPEHMGYAVEKGSIAIDGVSLTIAAMGDDWIRAAIVPHTAKSTRLVHKAIGSWVNIEVDIFAKYVERFVRSTRKSKGIDEEFLKKHGFI